MKKVIGGTYRKSIITILQDNDQYVARIQLIDQTTDHAGYDSADLAWTEARHIVNEFIQANPNYVQDANNYIRSQQAARGLIPFVYGADDN